jgi:hypothetical protein
MSLRGGLLVWSILTTTPGWLPGQGITTAALQGTVTQTDGTPIEAATVEVTNTADGRQWRVETRSGGRYHLENVAVGGPYRIAARAVGFQAAEQTGIFLALGQRYVADFRLEEATLQLPEVAVEAAADPLINPGRTGPAQIISESTLTRAANIQRQMFILDLQSPQVAFTSSGLSVGGQNTRYNGIQIDGGINNDLYTGAAPEEETLPLTISLEAVKEIQILSAPFDVREGSFTGGLFNAVTKSGTNVWEASGFGFFTDQSLVGKDAAGLRPSDFTNLKLGGSLAGPVVRDRLHFFLTADVQRLISPDPGPFIANAGADSVIGISNASALRFQQILANRYGLDPGMLGRSDTYNPAQDFFAKLTAQLGPNSQLEVSHHLGRGNFHGGVPRERGFYALTSATQRNLTTLNTSRVIWQSLVGPGSNELILSYLRQRDDCQPQASYPQIAVGADAGTLVAGPLDPSCPSTALDQDAVELSDNVSLGLGRHILTFGTHNELLHFRDPGLSESAGSWFFENLDSLESGQAVHYERGVPGPLRPEGPIADFRVRQIGLYLQDQWSPTSRLTLTGGLRLDVPFLPDRAVTNPSVRNALGLDTGHLPSGNPLWGPRLGFSYDLHGNGTAFVRGGIGLFSGRPPYRWVGNAYKGSGGEEAFLSCDGSDVPPFDPADQPATCGSGPEPVARIVAFDPDFRFPQNLKFSLGLDHRLPGGIVGTADLLYTRGVHQVYFTDANLGAPVGDAAGEGGRPLYGTIDADGSVSPARRDPSLGQVIRMSNRGADRALGLSLQLQKQFHGGTEFNASYTYARARDLMSLVNFGASFNLGNTPLDGTLEDRQLRTSFFEQPHRVWLSGSVNLPLGLRFSMLYHGLVREPYTYVVQGDVNADGIGVDDPGGPNNDIVYIPRSAVPGGDIALVVRAEDGTLSPAPASEYAELDRFIASEDCLRRQRGRIMELNSCHNGWRNFLQVRLSKWIPTVRGQALELTLDVFNLLHLLDSDWGNFRVAAANPFSSGGPQVPLLRLVGYDVAADRGIYQLALPRRNVLRFIPWRLGLGARYVF